MGHETKNWHEYVITYFLRRTLAWTQRTNKIADLEKGKTIKTIYNINKHNKKLLIKLTCDKNNIQYQNIYYRLNKRKNFILHIENWFPSNKSRPDVIAWLQT